MRPTLGEQEEQDLSSTLGEQEGQPWVSLLPLFRPRGCATTAAAKAEK